MLEGPGERGPRLAHGDHGADDRLHLGRGERCSGQQFIGKSCYRRAQPKHKATGFVLKAAQELPVLSIPDERQVSWLNAVSPGELECILLVASTVVVGRIWIDQTLGLSAAVMQIDD